MNAKNKKIIGLYSSNLFIYLLAGGIYYGIFVVFLSSVKGFSTDEISLISSIPPLVMLAVSPLWGKIIDKSKRLIHLTKLVTIANALTIIILVFTNNFWLFFIIAIAGSCLYAPSTSLMSEYLLAIEKKTGYPFGKVRVWGAIGYAISGLISPVFIDLWGTTGALLICGFIMLSTVIILQFIPELTTGENEEQIKNNLKAQKNDINAKEILFSLLKNKPFLIQLFATNVIMATCNSTSNYSIQVILEKLSCPTSLISTVPFIMVVMEIVFLFIFHKLPFAKKSYLATFTALVILCFRWYFMASIPNYMFLLLLMLVHGVVVGIMMPVQNNLIAELVPTKQQSTAFLFEVVVIPTIFSSILNLFTGYLSVYTGISIFGYTYLILSIIALVIIIPSFLKESRTKKSFC